MELSFYQGGQFQQLAAFPDVPTLGAPQHGVLPGCFMDMAAVKILGLFAIDKFSNRVTSEVLAFAGAMSGVPLGGVWQISTSGCSPENRFRRFVNSCSLYSPGVLNGVGFE